MRGYEVLYRPVGLRNSGRQHQGYVLPTYIEVMVDQRRFCPQKIDRGRRSHLGPICSAAWAKPSMYAAQRFSCGPGAERRDPAKHSTSACFFRDPVVLELFCTAGKARK